MEGLNPERLDRAINLIVVAEKRFPVPATILEYYRETEASKASYHDQPAKDMECKDALNTWAFLAEHLHGLTDVEKVQARRIATICTSCQVGDEWAKFRVMSPAARIKSLREFCVGNGIPGSVMRKFDAAIDAHYQTPKEARHD